MKQVVFMVLPLNIAHNMQTGYAFACNRIILLYGVSIAF
jgi:hypothetical protein